MTSGVKFRCELGITDASVPLGAEIWLDNIKILDLDPVTGSMPFSHEINDDEAEHQLRIVLKNKRPEHTQIDNQGEIISDARLTISNVSFDDIMLKHLLVKKSIYTHDFNGHGPVTQQEFYGEMGCNGVVSFKFNTPVLVWLLENM